MHLLTDVRRQAVKKCVRVEAMIAGVQVEVLDVKQDPGAGLAADQAEEFGVGQLRDPATRKYR